MPCREWVAAVPPPTFCACFGMSWGWLLQHFLLISLLVSLQLCKVCLLNCLLYFTLIKIKLNRIPKCKCVFVTWSRNSLFILILVPSTSHTVYYVYDLNTPCWRSITWEFSERSKNLIMRVPAGTPSVCRPYHDCSRLGNIPTLTQRNSKYFIGIAACIRVGIYPCKSETCNHCIWTSVWII